VSALLVVKICETITAVHYYNINGNTIFYIIAGTAQYQFNNMRLRIKSLRVYFGHDDEGCQQHGYDKVHPEQPAEERKVRSDHRAELRFDFFDRQFPRDYLTYEIDHFPFTMLPLLYFHGEPLPYIIILTLKYGINNNVILVVLSYYFD